MNFLEKEVEKAILSGKTYRILLTTLNHDSQQIKNLCNQLNSNIGYKKSIKCWYCWDLYNLSLENSRDKFKSNIKQLLSYQKENRKDLGIILINSSEFEEIQNDKELIKHKSNSKNSFFDVLLDYLKLR